ncbi:MAG: hypothetical protein ABR955_06955 [Verrucomicrobiota bacterium]|jgi:hypothetical protein
MSTPSFAQLFRRSRYSRSGPSGNDKQNQERLEIFAVAAVGFALRHDYQFKKNFLLRFAGIEEDIENYKPSLQAADCTDLKLENSKRHILVVTEFKVWAELQPKQNPWFESDDENLPFWNVTDKGEGYGHQYGNRSDFNQLSTVHYIVVQQKEKGDMPGEKFCEKFGKTFLLKRRNWESLLEPNTELEKDLVTSLGELGIEELEDYGYLSDNDRPFKAEVWFYCNENAKSELRVLIENELRSAVIQENPDENGLRIIRADTEALGDFEWFCKALGI